MLAFTVVVDVFQYGRLNIEGIDTGIDSSSQNAIS